VTFEKHLKEIYIYNFKKMLKKIKKEEFSLKERFNF